MRSYNLPTTFRWRVFYGLTFVALSWLGIVLSFYQIGQRVLFMPGSSMKMFNSWYIWLMGLVIVIASGIIWRRPY